jgi:hypothetical protein
MKELNLCLGHKQEWRQSHYAEHNCDYCKAQKLISELQTELGFCHRLIKHGAHSMEELSYIYSIPAGEG